MGSPNGEFDDHMAIYATSTMITSSDTSILKRWVLTRPLWRSESPKGCMFEVDQLHVYISSPLNHKQTTHWDRQRKQKRRPLIIDQPPLYPLSQCKTLKSRRRSKLEQPRPYKAADMACNENSRKTTHLVVIGPIFPIPVRQSDPEDLGGLDYPPL